MNPLLLIQLLAALAGAATRQSSVAEPDKSAAAPPAIDPALISALLAAAQRPAEPIPEVKMPKWIGALAVLFVIGFFSVLGGRIWLEYFGPATADTTILDVAFGVLTSGLMLILSFAFGSSFGSRQKDARRPAEPAWPPVVLPPTLPTPTPLPPLIEPPPVTLPGEEPPKPPPQVDNFPRLHSIIAKWEGGYSDHPADPGGPTNYGITKGVLGEWRGQPVTNEDVKNLTFAEALKIFRARYWEPLHCADLPAAIALMTYNTGVNSGIGRGARFLQVALNRQGAGLVEDGDVGPDTIAAAKKADARRLVEDYSAIYEEFYRSLSTFSTFGRGWLNRLEDVRSDAFDLTAEGVAPPPLKQPIDLAAAIVAAMQRKNYVLDTKQGEVNIVYVEGLSEDGTINNDAPDKWNDLRVVIGFDGSKPVILGKWEATTEPGRYYTDAPVNPAGAARIEFGQYTAWRVGVHRGHHEALVQRAPVTVCRDANKDMIRTGDARDTGEFGINQHGGYDQSESSIGKASAGCLVGRTMAGHRAFMAIVKQDPRFVEDPEFLFKTAILAEKDVVAT